MARATRGALSPGRIVDAALNLVDRDGPGALTMRRLGSELGAEAMSLYYHVRRREDLLDLVSDALADETLGQVPADAGWRETLRAWANARRAVAIQHRAWLPLVGQRPGVTGRARHVATLTAALQRDGFTGEAAHTAYHRLASYVVGFITAYDAPDVQLLSTSNALRERLALLDPGTNWEPVVAAFEACDLDEQYADGLDATLDGIARLRTTARTRTTQTRTKTRRAEQPD